MRWNLPFAIHLFSLRKHNPRSHFILAYVRRFRDSTDPNDRFRRLGNEVADRVDLLLEAHANDGGDDEDRAGQAGRRGFLAEYINLN